MTVGVYANKLPCMATESKSIPQLGELELQILEHLWKVSEADVQETHSELGAPRKISVNTVGSALERLYKKKLVLRDKVSHAYRYRPAMERGDFIAQRMVDAAGGLRALSEEGLLTAFVDVLTEANEETLDELAQLVKEKRRGRSK